MRSSDDLQSATFISFTLGCLLVVATLLVCSLHVLNMWSPRSVFVVSLLALLILLYYFEFRRIRRRLR
jgi:hypothetical protein